MKIIEDSGDILKVFEEQEERAVVNSPIAFVNGKLYYLIPIGKKIIENEDSRVKKGGKEGRRKGKSKGEKNSKRGIRVINFLGVLGASHGIAIAPSRFYTSDVVPHLQQYSKYISHLDFEIGGVNFTYYKNQGVKLLRCIKEALFEPEKVWKSDSSEIFTLVDILQYYVKYDSEITAYVVASWIFGTYLFPMFNYYPYLYFRGEKGSGKGTNLMIISKTAWNATDKFVSSREAPLFRLIEQAKPTLILDEYHRLLKNPYIGPAIESILEAGAEKGAKVVRCKEGDPNTVEHFDVYCPKVLASRRSTEIEEKSIVIVLPKTNDVRYAERRKELDYDPRFEEISYGLLKLAVNTWQQIYKEYKDLRPTKNLTGRPFNLWAPILAISKVVFPEKYEEILEFAENQVRQTFDERTEIEDIVLTAIYNNLDKLVIGGDISNLENNVLMTSLKEIRSWTDPELHHNTIRSALSNLKLIKTSRAGKLYIYGDRLKELFIERGYIEETSEEESEIEENKVEERLEEDFDKEGDFWICKRCKSRFISEKDARAHLKARQQNPEVCVAVEDYDFSLEGLLGYEKRDD